MDKRHREAKKVAKRYGYRLVGTAKNAHLLFRNRAGREIQCASSPSGNHWLRHFELRLKRRRDDEAATT